MLNEKASVRNIAHAWWRWITGKETKKDFWTAFLTGLGILTGAVHVIVSVYYLLKVYL